MALVYVLGKREKCNFHTHGLHDFSWSLVGRKRREWRETEVIHSMTFKTDPGVRDSFKHTHLSREHSRSPWTAPHIPWPRRLTDQKTLNLSTSEAPLTSVQTSRRKIPGRLSSRNNSSLHADNDSLDVPLNSLLESRRICPFVNYTLSIP